VGNIGIIAEIIQLDSIKHNLGRRRQFSIFILLDIGNVLMNFTSNIKKV
jgi:hypothetical protein